MKTTLTITGIITVCLLLGCGGEGGIQDSSNSVPKGDPIRGEPITVEKKELDSWEVVATEIKELNASAFRALTCGFDAVLGARGSKIQLVLNSLLHLESSPGNLSWEEYETIRDTRGVSEAYPIAVGDNFRGHRLVGALSEMFEKHEWRKGQKYNVLPEGRIYKDDAKEALVGSYAAQRLGLKVGDNFHPYHGLTFNEGAKHKDVYLVVGILEATGTSADNVIWIPVQGIQLMDGHDPKFAKDISAVLLKLDGATGFRLDMKYNQQGKAVTLAWPLERVLAGFFQGGLPRYLKLARQFGQGKMSPFVDGDSVSHDAFDAKDANVTIVEGEVTSAGGKIVSQVTSSEEREIVDLPPPPGSDSNFSNFQDPVVSNLPPLPKGSGYAPLSFASMSKFAYEVDWEKDGIKFDLSAFARRVPITVRQMDGLAAAVEGFMIPTVVNEENMVTEFLLLPDQMSCCFGKAPEANGWVVVTAPKGVEIMMDRIIRVTGTLAVEEKWDEEFFVGLYHMTCDKITGPAL